ncbi:transporter suffix domain-containing protein [Roseomonas aerophila]|uniref:Transporter suffix domain-containing protein n=1 Tax=Teichococcus aerophilus TaxID=1224513 RepID=A0ABR7RH96_9PROT|nr:transporter suffix domain-containing protein [Pseudoroseomonas aerophila]MBC9205934.1 transporter suffix domain-containing protein [Pseudoroseomonas aerophila]
MSTSEITAVPAASNWRFKLGIGIFILAFALWLLIPLAASQGATTARIAGMTGAIFVANKVLLFTCIAVMGKAGFQQLKSLVFGYAKGLAPAGPIGPARHFVGLVMFSLPLISAMLEPYVDQFWPGLRPNIWQLQALGDLMLLASFFVLGGDFWSKIRALFIRTAKVVDSSDTGTAAGA